MNDIITCVTILCDVVEILNNSFIKIKNQNTLRRFFTKYSSKPVQPFIRHQVSCIKGSL